MFLLIILEHTQPYLINLKKNEALCYELATKELNSLSFSPKLLGFKYLLDLISNLYINSSLSHGKCNLLYPIISIKYETEPCSIERSIRFCIENAFAKCHHKELFYAISQSDKIPTIKEFVNFLLDKITIQINKLCT